MSWLTPRPRARGAATYTFPAFHHHRRPQPGCVTMDLAFVDREQPRLLQELSDFLSIPSVSTLSAHEADTRRAAEWVRTELTRLGCPIVDLIEGAGHPVVWAEGPVVPGRPTLLIYGHYDVQPPDPLEEWESPPFVPTVRDGKLYARGATDDKGQVFCLLKAYESVLGEDGRPPLNVHFLFEGEEESGGRVVFDLLRAEPERTRADAVLVSDSSFFAPGLPAVYTTLRGTLLRRDLGSHPPARSPLRDVRRRRAQRAGDPGADPEPAQERRRRDPHPQALQGGPEALEEGAQGLAQAPLRRGGLPSRRGDRPGPHRPRGLLGFRADLGAPHLRDPRHPRRIRGRGRQDRHSRSGGREGEPAAGTGSAVREGRPAARARRCPPGTVLGGRERHAAARRRPGGDLGGPPGLRRAGRCVRGGGGEPHGAGALRGLDPHRAGAWPGGCPGILTGISLPDDGLHSPNEKLDLSQLWTGIRVFGRFFELFAERGGTAEEETQERTDKSEAQEGGAEQEAMETV